MPNSVEWVSVERTTAIEILGPQDEASDYQTPADDESDTSTHGLAVGGVCLTGSLRQLRDFLRSALDTVETALTSEGSVTGEHGTVVSGEPESLECVCGNCANFEGLISATPEGIALELHLRTTPKPDALAGWPQDEDEVHTLCRVCGRLYRDATIRTTNTAPVVRTVDLSDGTPAKNALIAHDAEIEFP